MKRLLTCVWASLMLSSGLLVAQSEAPTTADAQPRAVSTEHHSDAPFSALEAALSLRTEGRLEDARLALQALLTEHSDFLPAGLELAMTLAWLGQHQASLERYETILRQDPSNMHAMAGRAWVSHWAGKNGDAVAWFERAIEHGSDSVAMRYGIARAHSADGRNRKAREMLERLVEQHPEHLDSRTLLDELTFRPTVSSRLSLNGVNVSQGVASALGSFSVAARLRPRVDLFASLSSQPALVDTRLCCSDWTQRVGATWKSRRNLRVSGEYRKQYGGGTDFLTLRASTHARMGRLVASASAEPFMGVQGLRGVTLSAAATAPLGGADYLDLRVFRTESSNLKASMAVVLSGRYTRLGRFRSSYAITWIPLGPRTGTMARADAGFQLTSFLYAGVRVGSKDLFSQRRMSSWVVSATL